MHIANYEPNRVGGGWTFANYLARLGHEDYEKAKIYFICSPTMAQRDEVERAKADGKKIVLRIDNAVRNSRNRNTGMSRMYDFAQMADLVIYQSKWARDYLYPFTKKDGPVILNGVDTNLFKPTKKIENSYIYSRFNRDETKGWEVARYWFSQNSANSKLWIVGNFSPELIEGNFDFYMEENYQFIPTMRHEDYASLLNTMENFVYTYYNDAMSNSLIEALWSGCKIVGPEYFRRTGGAPEIFDAWNSAREKLTVGGMLKAYRKHLESIL